MNFCGRGCSLIVHPPFRVVLPLSGGSSNKPVFSLNGEIFCLYLLLCTLNFLLCTKKKTRWVAGFTRCERFLGRCLWTTTLDWKRASGSPHCDYYFWVERWQVVDAKSTVSPSKIGNVVFHPGQSLLTGVVPPLASFRYVYPGLLRLTDCRDTF